MRRVLIAASLVLLAGAVSFAQEKIKIGYFDNPPHIFKGADKVEGALVEYWEKYAAPGMKVGIEWVGPLPPARLFAELQEGNINSIALLSKNPDREKLYDYPDKPFQDVKAGVAVLKERKGKISTVDSLKGLQISFFKDGNIAPPLKAVDIKWDFISDTTWKTLGLKKLGIKRVDAVYDPDVTTLDYAIKSSKEFSDLLVAVPVEGLDSKNYSLFSKKDGGKYLALYNQFRAKSAINYSDLLAAYLK